MSLKWEASPCCRCGQGGRLVFGTSSGRLVFGETGDRSEASDALERYSARNAGKFCRDQTVVSAPEDAHRHTCPVLSSAPVRKRSNSAVHLTDESFIESLLSTSMDGVLVTEVSGTVIIANKAFAQFFGQDNAALVNTPLADWICRMGRLAASAWADLERRLLVEGRCPGAAISAQFGDVTRHFSVSASLSKPVQTGVPEAIISIWRDVSEERRAEQNLQSHVEKLRSAQRVARIGFFEWNLDSTNAYCSPELCKMAGFEPKSGEQDLFELIHPDDRRAVRDRLYAVIESDNGVEFEHRMVTQNGEVIWVHTDAEWVVVGDHPVVIGTTMNITERKHAQALAERHTLQQQLLNETSQRALTGQRLDELSHHVALCLESQLQLETIVVLQRLDDTWTTIVSVGSFSKELERTSVRWAREAPQVERVVEMDLAAGRGLSILIGSASSLWGLIIGYRNSKAPLQGDQIQFVQALADILGQAVRRSSAESETAHALVRAVRARDESDQLVKASKAILGGDDFEQTAKEIFDLCKQSIGATAGYMTRLDRERQLDVLIVQDGLEVPESLPVTDFMRRAYERGTACFQHSPEGAPDSEETLIVPLRSGNVPMGHLAFTGKPTSFDDDDVRLAAAYAELASISLRKFQIEEAQRHAVALNLAVAESSIRFLESDDLRRTAEIVAEQAVLLTDAEFGFLLNLDDKGEVRVLAHFAPTSSGKDPDERANDDHLRGLVPEAIMSEVLRRRVVLTNHYSSLSNTISVIDALLIVPIRKGEAVVGAIALANRPGGFTSRERVAIELLANAAAMVLKSVADTEKKRYVEEQLRQGQRMESIGRLAGGVAHDFNNLLTVILSSAELISNEIHETDPISLDIEQIREAGLRAVGLTRQLLTFSRKQVLQPEVLDLNVAVSDLERMLHRLIGENIELVTRACDSEALVEADRGQLDQVIMNLVINARDAMPAGGRLTLETFTAELPNPNLRGSAELPPGHYVGLRVRDTGEGMDAETLERVFEPFFTTKPTGKGTGLGLATVYGIVRQSRGAISVESKPGVGTSFEILLPNEKACPTPESKPIGLADHGNETILIVEDEEVVRRLAVRILEMRGYRVIAAKNSLEALDIGLSYPDKIHLLLSDVIMPGTNGKETAEVLLRQLPDLKVLFMSGYSDEAINLYGVDDFAINFIHKPFTIDGLSTKVREVLDH